MNRKPTSYVLAALGFLPVLDNPGRGDQAKGQPDMKTFAISLVSSVCVLAVLAWPQTSRAQVFQTTFNIPEWQHTLGITPTDANLPPDGDKIQAHLDLATSNGSLDRVTTAANMAAGGGGRGLRHWIGDGTNNNGGGFKVSWTPASEIWIRLYIRFQLGFHFGAGTPYHKVLYINQAASQGTIICGLEGGFVGGHVELDGNHGQGAGNHFSSVTFAQWQSGGPDGDGLWHAFEVHAKMNPLGAVANGVLEFWLDGTKVYTNSSVKFATVDGTKFSFTVIGSNSFNPQNGGVDQAIDYDDIVVSTTGYIGPIGGFPAPRNLRVQ